MLRDFKFLRRNSGKSNEEIENVPINPRDSSVSQAGTDPSRPPLNTIQDPVPNPGKIDKTPTKPKTKNPDSTLHLRTPDKYGLGFSKNRFGRAQKSETGTSNSESRDDMMQVNRAGLVSMTPRGSKGAGRANSSYSESNSTQSTPTKSVSKPPTSAFRSKVDGSNGGVRAGNIAALYKGIPISSGSATTVVNTVEVPHFDLKEDPSFWMDHNVQVLIRVRPLNSMERSMHGYNRCLKQESAQSITWIGQPEAQFTFDHVACETVDQEMLFRLAGLPMVENCLSGYNSCMFAYGQTGSGKTYTMLGEIDDLEVRPSPQRGMTPRIFEFLFARIQAEEESRRDEKLKYSCKCSFLEIYNEQITDLLDPSSTNLLLREDVKKGVYVENLSEFEVQTVSDILKLLTQGSLNRKVAATNMNRESSRSHSVFTCVIESRWEKDSTTNLRFARLNLVDLAGSERQKSSGAEGERLKEAANINKSLSTLGHVIMILVDVAHGRPKHVPYRDSRLTFLLQDSLGGNSKTMVIANVSPSICCAAETLNTLKFSQRAKLIQNNAVVNEDSTGDVIALQHQIRLLKEELSLLKHQNVTRSLSFGSTTIKDPMQVQDNTCAANPHDMDKQHVDDLLGYESRGIVQMSTKQLKSLETTLAGALRREQMAETSTKKLEAEIEQLNRLVRQREEDTRSTKMMLRFREDKIQRMESLLAGTLPHDSYLLEENRVLSEETKLLRAKVDKNPEVTRFALENIRLLDQLRRFQEFYEEGEREILLDEVSTIREQLLQFLEGNSKEHNHPNLDIQPQEVMCISKENDSLHLELKNTLNELEKCRRNLNSCLEENGKLRREVQDLCSMSNNLKSTALDHDDYVIKTVKDSWEYKPLEHRIPTVTKNEADSKHSAHELNHAEDLMDLQLELDIVKIMLKEERASRGEIEERAICLNRDVEVTKEKLLLLSTQFEGTNGELKEAKSVIEALESQQIQSINEIDNLRKKNNHYVKLLSEQELEIIALKEQISRRELRDHQPQHSEMDSALQVKMCKMQHSLEKAKRLNMWYQSDHAFQRTNEAEMDEVRRQAEAETAEVIVCMQEELSNLQQQVHDYHLKEMETEKVVMLLKTELKELQEKLYLMAEDNKVLHGRIEEKDGELRSLSDQWELLACEIEEVVADGHVSIMDASDQLDLISSSFPQKRIWISEKVGGLITIISEKELLIEQLNRCLDDANTKRSNVECMLKTLRGAALVINEAHQKDCNEKEKEINVLTSKLRADTSSIAKLKDRLKQAENNFSRASVCATAAFVIVDRLSEVNLNNLNTVKHKDAQLIDQAAAIEEAEKEIQCLRMKLAELEETCNELQQKLSEEEKRAYSMEQKLEYIEENDISMTREKLDKLKTGVSALRSCMSTYKEDDKIPENDKTQGSCTSPDGKGKGQADTKDDLRTDVSECSFKVGKSSCGYSSDQKNMESGRTCKDACDRDVTIILLKREIESALESLQDVQAEMATLRHEKEEIWLSEKQNQESMKCLTGQILALQEAVSNFEHQFGVKIGAVNHKLQALEHIVQEAGTDWCQTKELLELEVGDAKIIAVQKAAEASCIVAKFEEAQDTMKEADIMINGLMIANETMKLNIERLRQREMTLTDERDRLANELQNLQSIVDLKDREFENLDKQLGSNVTEIRNLAVELEHVIAQVQTAFKENLMSIAGDFQQVKAVVSASTRLVRSLLEDVWSEIIVKDCAVSVLHLCHMGILLETVTGLNAENGLLHHGLSESNSVIADLREHNSKSSRELQMCRNLKGKLLADIKNSFDRISRKEEETGDISVKLITFEKRISDLQLQEELMLQRSNYMGSQLAILMKELDFSNTNVVASLLDQEKLMKEKEEILKSHAELLMMELSSKDIESLVLASELEQMALQAEREHTSCDAVLENLKREMIFSMIDAELKEQVLVTKETEVSLLQEEAKDATRDRQDLLSRLDQYNLRISQKDQLTKALEQDIQLLKDVAHSNDMLKGELGEVCESKVNLLNQVQALEAKCERLLNDIKVKETALECSFSQISVLDQQNQKLQENVCLLETSLSKLHNQVDLKDAELSRKSCLEEENKSLKIEITMLKTENNLVLQDLEVKKSEVESSISHKDISEMENQRLRDKVFSLETLIASLQTDLEVKISELDELQHCQSSIMEDLHKKSLDLLANVDRVHSLKEENILLRNELRSYEKDKQESFAKSSLNLVKCIKSVDIVDAMGSRLCNVLNKENYMIVDKIFHEICENVEMAHRFTEELESLECQAKRMLSENTSLQTELSRKDDVLNGLLFDLSLLQESASNSKDQKDELEQMVASLEALEDELAVRSAELEKAVAHSQMLEAQLKEKGEIISALELDISKEHGVQILLSSENLELRDQIEDALRARHSLEQDLKDRRNTNESLEIELSEMSNALGQMNKTIESLRSNLNDLTIERDKLHVEALGLRSKVEEVQAWAEENEAVAVEAQQIAESRKIYAEEKEAEIKLLERSVEELERTVNVLESKVDIVKGEAERQRLQREELELELHALNHQMQNVNNADADMKKNLDEKEEDLQQALKQLQILERDMASKDAEIAQFKVHISELNLHAEAQASEYKQKFKALEAMAEQVRPEGNFTHVSNSSSNKLEKNASKSRGSGSPFKCIGLGLAQQIKSEKDEELTVARLRIEELESLTVSRQKEIFALNARLASAESMTHDVIRDLLGVKLDMTNYVTLLDNQQVQKIAEKARLNGFESQVKEQEVIKLRQQLNEFIEERQRWLEEIDRKQAELVAAQIALEKLRQRDQLLKTENEMLKMESVTHKKKVMELEGEVKKLSGQQNLQQRIHHHAKIKEENNMLKIQNEDLGAKLQRTEIYLSRAKEELAHYRSSFGKNPHINFDEEQRLNNKLKETEDDRMQLAQKLLALCTSILKAAGITKHVSDVTPMAAEEAIEQLKSKLTSLEGEIQDLKFKNRISNERVRLSELMPQTSPVGSRADDNRQTPRRASQTPFLYALDR